MKHGSILERPEWLTVLVRSEAFSITEIYGSADERDSPVRHFGAGRDEPYVARYSLRGSRYALLEAGHWAQELMRTFELAGLGTVPLGAFDDAALKTVLGGRLTGAEPLYAVAVGATADVKTEGG